jgi:hypothetical protein
MACRQKIELHPSYFNFVKDHTLDTTTATQTTVVAGTDLHTMPQNGCDFMRLI